MTAGLHRYINCRTGASPDSLTVVPGFPTIKSVVDQLKCHKINVKLMFSAYMNIYTLF